MPTISSPCLQRVLQLGVLAGEQEEVVKRRSIVGPSGFFAVRTMASNATSATGERQTECVAMQLELVPRIRVGRGLKPLERRTSASPGPACCRREMPSRR